MNPQIVKLLEQQIAALREAIGEHDADDVLRADMLEGETDIDQILARLIRARNYAKADQAGAKAALDDAANRYKARITAAEAREAAALKMIASIMGVSGLTSRKLPEGTISIQDGRESLSLADDFVPPQGYQRVKVEPDKKAILEALKSGATIPGAEIVIGNKIVMVR